MQTKVKDDLIGVKKRTVNKYNRKRNIELTILALPAMLVIFVFRYLPMGGLVMAFQDFRYDMGIFGSKFIGFDNFKFFFSSSDFIRVTRNTLVYNMVFIITTIAFSIVLALFLYEISNKIAIKTFQTMMFLPYFTTMVVVGYIVLAFLSTDLGIINNLRIQLGLDKVMWYSEKKYWIYILPIVNLWKGIGYNTIIFYTGLLGIDSTLFEAAHIDGASKFQVIKKISIPSLSKLTFILVLMQVGRIFYADFGLFYVVPTNSGVLYPVTDVIDTYIYRALTTVNDIGMASAVGFYQALTGCVLVIITNYCVKKFNDDGQGLF